MTEMDCTTQYFNRPWNSDESVSSEYWVEELLELADELLLAGGAGGETAVEDLNPKEESALLKKDKAEVLLVGGGGTAAELDVVEDDGTLINKERSEMRAVIVLPFLFGSLMTAGLASIERYKTILKNLINGSS